MKTLDEVIAMMEYEASYNSEEQGNHDADALHYLKEYHEHLKWQAYEEHCLIEEKKKIKAEEKKKIKAEEKKKIKQAYEQGYAQAKHDDEVSRSWEESYRQSQMPWNHYTEMGG